MSHCNIVTLSCHIQRWALLSQPLSPCYSLCGLTPKAWSWTVDQTQYLILIVATIHPIQFSKNNSANYGSSKHIPLETEFGTPYW